jgi:hypothetical protein
MAAFKLINGYGHKSFKAEGVSSLKEMNNQLNRMRAPTSRIHGLRCRIGEIWSAMDKFSLIFYSILYKLVIFVTNM